MGCFGSKPVQPPVDTNARQKTARPSGTARPQHTSARQPTGAHPPSRQRQSRSGHPGHRTGNRQQNRLPVLDEQPEDVAISDSVIRLAATIEGHCRNYYPGTKALVTISRRIGRRIVNHAIMGDDNLVSITGLISNDLREYQSEYSGDREAHLQSLVEEGRRIKNMIAQHRGKWSFGAWDEGVKFPSLLKNGLLVTEPR